MLMFWLMDEFNIHKTFGTMNTDVRRENLAQRRRQQSLGMNENKGTKAQVSEYSQNFPTVEKVQCPLLPVRPPEIDKEEVLLQLWLTHLIASSFREEKDTMKSWDILLLS